MPLTTHIHACNAWCTATTHCAVVPCYGTLATAADVLAAYQRHAVQTGMHVLAVTPARESPDVAALTTLVDAAGRRTQYPRLPLTGWWLLQFQWLEEETL